MTKDLKQEFIDKSIAKFGPKFDFTDTIYINGQTDITYKCSDHGFIIQKPRSHLDSVFGCPQCFIGKRDYSGDFKPSFLPKLNNQTYKERGEQVHQKLDGTPKYGYHFVEYKDIRTKVTHWCFEHEIKFDQIPNGHLNGKVGCPECRRIKSTGIFTNKGQVNFIKESKEIYGDKFKYDLLKYIDQYTPAEFYCNDGQHSFWQKPFNHLLGKGCNICKPDYFEIFKDKVYKKFGDKFDLTSVKYINNNTEIIVPCNRHGEFKIKPINLLNNKYGCYQCYLESDSKIKKKIIIPKDKEPDRLKRLDTFIKKAQLRHVKEDGITPKYKYNKILMLPKNQKEIFICDEHDEFLQTRREHLRYGCLLCGQNNLSENKLFHFLEKRLKNIKLKQQGKPKWLGRQSLDMYLSDYNIAIEYQGAQHFRPIKHWGYNEGFLKQLERDDRKRLRCFENNCKLFYFTYDVNDIPKNYKHKVYTDEKDLLKEIRKLINPKFLVKFFQG